MPAMDDMMGDDFGDLYADYVVSETSAIVSNFINLYAEPQPQEKEDDTSSNCNGNHKVKSCLDGEKQLSNGGLRDSEADGSDSEDDLNIVLNDDGPLARNGNKFNNEGGYEEDDDGEAGISVGTGSGKNVSDPSVDRKDVKISATAYNSSNSAHVNKHGRHYESSYQINKMANESTKAPSLIRPSMNSLASYGGYGFSLPWYRTILDVNIDAFQEKRWRLPGVDITDFFNFGFNEDTWKLYCITLEQLRQQSYMNSWGPFHEPSNITQACEVGSQRERVMQEAIAGNTTTQVGSSSKSSDMGDQHVGLIKGQAIQVEDSRGERLATMDLQCPRSWDSDVVIEINFQDTNETSSVSEEEEVAHINATSPQASKCTDLNMDDKRYVHSSDGASGGEQSGESIEGNIRYSKPALGCKESSMDSDNLKNGWISDADGHLQQNMKAQTSKDVTEATEIAEKGEAEICKGEYKLHQHAIESESSLGDQSHFSLTLSCFESDSEASTDGVDGTPKESPRSSPCSSRRLLPGTDLTETVAPDHKSPKKNGALRKPRVSQNSSRDKSHILEGRKHQTRGHRRLSGQKSCFYESYNGPPVHRCRSPVDCIGRIEKLHDFDYRKGEDFSYYEQKDFSSDYGSEKIADDRIEAVCMKRSRREYHKHYRDDLRLWESRNWNEREYLREKGIGYDYQDDRDRDWYICRRVLSPKDRIPTYRESRPLVSKYDDSKQRDNRWRSRSDKISFGERTIHDSYCLDHQNGGPRKYGRSISFASWKRKRETLDGRCERKNSFIDREVNYSGRRVRCCDSDCPSLNLDSSSYMGMEDGYWNPKHEHLSHRSKREQDMVLPRIGDMFYSRFTERYGRCRRQVYDSDRRENVWVYPDGDSSYHDKENMCYDIIYPDDQVNLGRRKFCAEPVILSEAQDELVLSHQDDRFYSGRKSGYYGKCSNNEGLHSKFRSPGRGTTFDDMWQKKHRYKAIRQGGSSNNVTRISKMIYRGEDETASSGKSSGNLMCNVNLEKMDVRRFAEKPATMNGLSESRTGKAAQIFEGDHGDDKWVDKFPVKKQNKDSDFEEGELMTEEVNIRNKLGVKRNSEGGSSTCHVQKGISDRENSSNGNQSSCRKYDDQRIRDSMAKMEKRRERFKDPIPAKMEADKSSKSQVDTIETKAERPSRKRRWCGS